MISKDKLGVRVRYLSHTSEVPGSNLGKSTGLFKPVSFTWSVEILELNDWAVS